MKPQNCVSPVMCEIDREIKCKFSVLLSNVTTIANLITDPWFLPDHLVHSRVFISILGHAVLKSEGKIVFYNRFRLLISLTIFI